MTDKKAPVLLESRTISGRGLFTIAPDKNIRQLLLYLNLVRLPQINFTSSKWNPDKSEYAKITWSRDEYILREGVMQFEHELHTWEQDIVGYAGYAHVCMYNSVIAYFDYLAPALGLAPFARSGFIYLEPLQNLPDAIKIVCRLDTAITAELWKYEYDIACPEADSTPPPPPNPPKPNRVPPGVSIGDISPPYNSPDDGGDTVPNTGDETVPPLPPGQGEVCSLVTVNFEYDEINGGTVQSFVLIYAPYYDIYISREGIVGTNYAESIKIICAKQNTTDCNDGTTQTVDTGYSATIPVASAVRFLGLS